VIAWGGDWACGVGHHFCKCLCGLEEKGVWDGDAEDERSQGEKILIAQFMK
jgi:hypothetical protein